MHEIMANEPGILVCPLCLDCRTGRKVRFQHFLHESHRLFPYSNATFHVECFDGWEFRDEFLRCRFEWLKDFCATHGTVLAQVGSFIVASYKADRVVLGFEGSPCDLNIGKSGLAVIQDFILSGSERLGADVIARVTDRDGVTLRFHVYGTEYFDTWRLTRSDESDLKKALAIARQNFG